MGAHGRLTKNLDFVKKKIFQKPDGHIFFGYKRENKKKFMGNLPMIFFWD